MRFDQYNRTARLLPAIICSLPFFVLYYFLLANSVSAFIQSIIHLRLVAGIGINVAFVFLLAHVSRLISKNIFERYVFDDGIRFPTTNYLLHSDPYYTPEYTLKIHEKIEIDFTIKLSSPDEEAESLMLAKKKINEAISHVRRRVGNGVLTLQHNIEYGFFRNLIGGSVIAVIVSLINLYFLKGVSVVGVHVSLAMLCFYLLPIVFCRWIMRRTGEAYARVLVQEYMADGVK